MGEPREDIERMIAEELRSHHQATGPWVRAMVEADGDFDLARKRYRELRLAQLCAAREGDGPLRVRTELCHELERHKRASIYSVVGIAPDAGDAEVAAAIARIVINGTTLDADARYAVEVLGDEIRRSAYDHQLLQQLRGSRASHTAAPRVEMRAVPRHPVAPRSPVPPRRSMRDIWLGLGAVFVGLTYLGTEHYRELRNQEIQHEAAARHAAMSKARRIATEPADAPGATQAGVTVPVGQLSR